MSKEGTKTMTAELIKRLRDPDPYKWHEFPARMSEAADALEAAERVIARYRYAAEFNAAEGWDACPEGMDRLRWAREMDHPDSALSPHITAAMGVEYHKSRPPFSATGQQGEDFISRGIEFHDTARVYDNFKTWGHPGNLPMYGDPSNLTPDELSRLEQMTTRALAAERERCAFLEAENRRLRDERNDADRRAGAAERHFSSLEDEKRARNSWLILAKEERGYSDNTSFDVVWTETCAKADRAEAAEAKLARLREPDEAMVEAVVTAMVHAEELRSVVGSLHEAYVIQATATCRAIANNLDTVEPKPSQEKIPEERK